MKVYFLPPGSALNNSFNMIVEGLEKNGVIITNKGKDGNALIKALSSFDAYFRGTRIFHFNFLENYAANKSIKAQVLSSIILIWLKILKLLRCRLIWTMNNKVPHNCNDGGEFYHRFMHKYLLLMDATVVYCEESKNILIEKYGYDSSKICSVAHGCYVPHSRPTKVVNEDGKLHILCFGLISEYKNVPLLIEAVKEADLNNSILRIYGRCETVELKNRIIKEMEGCVNIEFYEGFLPENEVDSVFEWADVMACPYDKNSMLNSGAVIMGVSQGKVTLATEFGYIKDICDKPFIISYDYMNEEDHILRLSNILIEMEKSYIDNPDLFEKKGMDAYYFSRENLDWNSICKRIIDFYE